MGTDLLLVTVYLICVGYVVYRMYLELKDRLQDEVTVVLDGDNLVPMVRTQLTQQYVEGTVTLITDGSGPLGKGHTLQLDLALPQMEGAPVPGKLLVQVLPQGPRPMEPPIAGLEVKLLNHLSGIQVQVDWDRSTLMLFSNQARRAIRQTPGIGLDLGHAQAASVVHPDQMLQATVTTEDAYGRSAETNLLQPAAPLIVPEPVLTLPPDRRYYALYLALHLRQEFDPTHQGVALMLPFQFHIEPLPDTSVIPLPFSNLFGQWVE